MKKTLCLLISGLLVAAFWSLLSQAEPAQALNPANAPAAGGKPQAAATPTPGFDAITPPDAVNFSLLGMADRAMHGPYDSMRVRFSVPPDWALTPGVSLQLDLHSFFSNPRLSPTASPNVRGGQPTGGSLEVYFNDIQVSTITLDWAGDQTFSIPIPASALLSPRQDGRHEVFLFLDSAVDCSYDYQTVLTVRSSSRVSLPHQTVPLSTNLTQFPQPMYQIGAYWPNQTVIVVPNSPSVTELQSAFTISAGLGRLTSGQLPMTLLPISSVTDAVRQSSHLIFVGKPSAFPILSSVRLPAAREADQYLAADSKADDGIVQMAISPWNSSKVILILGGSSDAAVLKAAQAASSGVLRVGNNSSLALVQDVQPIQEAPSVAEDRTLADLGYKTESLQGVGYNSIDYYFYIPPGQTTNDNADFALTYIHSALIDYARSGLFVYLNDQTIASGRFTDTTTQMETFHVKVPAYALKSGMNRLTVEVNFFPLDTCSQFALDSLWATISADSKLHIPLTPITINLASLQDLRNYPHPFVGDANLGGTALVVPVNSPMAWQIASHIASDLGARTNGALVEIKTAYANSLPDALRQSSDLILVGRPSALPILSELQAGLPAPFDAGDDFAKETGMTIRYRFPPGTDLGYLELMPAPWNTNREILAVMGSTEKGLQWAGDALTDPTMRNQLSGNFAVVHEKQILTSDTRIGLGTGNLSATLAPTAIAQITEIKLTPAPERPGWLLPALIASAILFISILTGVIVIAIRRRNPFSH